MERAFIILCKCEMFDGALTRPTTFYVHSFLPVTWTNKVLN